MIAVMNAASSDWAAARLAAAIEHVAIALAEPEETQQRILPAHEPTPVTGILGLTRSGRRLHSRNGIYGMSRDDGRVIPA